MSSTVQRAVFGLEYGVRVLRISLNARILTTAGLRQKQASTSKATRILSRRGAGKVPSLSFK